MSRRDVPFSLVAIVLFILILAVFVFYIYRNETLLIIALLLLIILALSLRLIRAMNLFRPRRQQSQVNHSKKLLFILIPLARQKEFWKINAKISKRKIVLEMSPYVSLRNVI